MARKMLVALDLNKNELRNAVVQVLATAPSSPAAGQIYFDSVANKPFIYNGSAWKAMDEYVAIDYAESDDMVASAPGDTVSAGTSSEVSRGDHKHARESYGSSASTQAIGDSPAAGTSGDVSRADHKHGLPGFANVTAQTSAGASSANGTATTVARSDHAHGTPSHTGTDHASVSLSSLSAPTGDLAIGGYKLTGVATPLTGTDAANKNYVDSAVEGLSWKTSVRVSTTTAGTLASSFENGDTVDGVTLATGDRILVKNQSAGAENGIYVVKASGAPDRADDASTAAELRGAAVFIEEGDTLAGTQWILTTDNITLGSTSLTFAQFGAQITYSAGDGLTLSGSTFNVGAGTGISVAADTVSIDTSVVARKYATDLTGSSTSYTVTHNLGTQDVHVTIYDTTTYATVECDIVNATTNTVTVGFASAPSSGAYRAVVIG